MKQLPYLALGILLLNLVSASAQPGPSAPPRPGSPPPYVAPATPSVILTKFDLDYPGGTPATLVSAIEKATGKPLNVIIPDDLANTPMPQLRMKNVDVVQLFKALELASEKQENVVTGTYFGGINGQNSSQWQSVMMGYGFKTQSQPSDDSIWYFYALRPAKPPTNQPAKACRFYPLAPYLDSGLTVEDITTAIQTGWKMMGYSTNKATFVGVPTAPTISFHKETKLLIATGELEKLETIDSVLQALSYDMTTPKSKKVPGNNGNLPKSDK
jgi:hypothetical protein